MAENISRKNVSIARKPLSHGLVHHKSHLYQLVSDWGKTKKYIPDTTQ